MKSIRTSIIFIFLICILFSVYNIYTIESQRRVIKEDLIELSKIKYGLFSVDEWKQIISRILTKKLEELNFNPEQRAEMRDKIENFLITTIEDFESRYYDEKSQTLWGTIESGIASLTGMFDKIKKDVPIFTEQILDFLSTSDNRDKVKNYLMEKLSDYTDKTFSKIDYQEHDRILAQYAYGDRNQTITGLNSEVDNLKQKEWVFIAAIFALIIFTFLSAATTASISKGEFLLYAFICSGLLCSGLILPMIEIDARVEEMSFTLLGEKVTFIDQVLYYKSKSILEVVRLMLAQGKWDVFMVGILVLTFSVIFPISKLLSSVAYIYRPNLHSNRLIRLMVFRTGKWSMADVMVIAIFMSYIGFSGILTEQLNQIENLSNKIDILTTNKSSLQTGFFLFTAFVILSLILSDKLQYRYSSLYTGLQNKQS